MISLNGHIISSPDEQLFLNRAFSYGDGVFETIRVINYVPLFLSEHFNRLERACKIVELKLPENFRVLFTEHIQEIISRSNYSSARVRLTVFRQAGGAYIPQTDNSEFLIQISPLKEDFYLPHPTGLQIDVFKEHLKPLNILSTIKSCSALPTVIAGNYARKNNLDDVVLINELGSIAEATSSNIFVLINNVLYTPDTNQGILSGIMRQQVIELAREMKREVVECQLPPEILNKADEIFLTNVIKGIVRVKGYKNRRFFHDFSDQLINLLNQKIKLITAAASYQK
jgi:branched-chain amino acid aminotransferase